MPVPSYRRFSSLCKWKLTISGQCSTGKTLVVAKNNRHRTQIHQLDKQQTCPNACSSNTATQCQSTKSHLEKHQIHRKNRQNIEKRVFHVKQCTGGQKLLKKNIGFTWNISGLVSRFTWNEKFLKIPKIPVNSGFFGAICLSNLGKNGKKNIFLPFLHLKITIEKLPLSPLKNRPFRFRKKYRKILQVSHFFYKTTIYSKFSMF